MRYDKILPIQLPNSKKKRFSCKTIFFQDFNSAMDLWQRAATCSHSPRKFQARGLQVAASGPKATPLIEGSLDGKLPTIWADENQSWEESEKRREEQRRS
jgi:hypothetical protein